MSRRKTRKLQVRVAAAVAVASLAAISMSLTSAHASIHSGPQGGQGSSQISGYTVSGLHFELGATGGVTAVHFQLSPAGARTAQVQVATNGAWAPCTVSGGSASCNLPAGTSAGALDQLSVVASS